MFNPGRTGCCWRLSDQRMADGVWGSSQDITGSLHQLCFKLFLEIPSRPRCLLGAQSYLGPLE